MALCSKSDLLQVYNNNPQLQQFVLSDVTPTGRVLGTGSYESVVEVKYQTSACAGKKLRFSSTEGVAMRVVEKYLQECLLMSSLRHPNIIQFYGVCFLPEDRLPLLVMEQLEISFDDLLKYSPDLSLSLKCSVLEDVASGLLYLHKRPSPVIHRNLNPNNVLLTSSLVAKISDIGNWSVVENRVLPVTADRMYIPPDVDLGNQPSFDILSFGKIALYSLTQQVIPCEISYTDQLVDLLESEPASHFPDVVQLVKNCLHNDPQQRPTTDELLALLQRMKVEVEGRLGASIKPDIEKVKLIKEMKFKDKRIEELTHQQRSHEVEQIQLREENKKLRDRLGRCRAITPNWKYCCSMPFEMGNYVQCVSVQNKVYVGGGDAGESRGMSVSHNDCVVMEYRMDTDTWDTLPIVKLEPGTLEGVAMDLDLPICYFTMTVMNRQLVLVGGYCRGQAIQELAVWDSRQSSWTHPYPGMNTARSRSSAVVYKDWLVVAGGWSEPDNGRALSIVEVMNTGHKQWHSVPQCQTQIPWFSMKVAVVNDMCYFLGGYTRSDVNQWRRKGYRLSFTALLSHIDPNTVASGCEDQVWKEISTLPMKYCSPLSISGYLLAVGGEDGDDGNTAPSTKIHLYQPDSDSWVELNGALPTPRCKCSCVLSDEGYVVVAGGNKDGVMLKAMNSIDKTYLSLTIFTSFL